VVGAAAERDLVEQRPAAPERALAELVGERAGNGDRDQPGPRRAAAAAPVSTEAPVPASAPQQ